MKSSAATDPGDVQGVCVTFTLCVRVGAELSRDPDARREAIEQAQRDAHRTILHVLDKAGLDVAQLDHLESEVER